MFTIDQFLTAQKANLETLSSLTRKALDGVEKIIELNLQAAREAIKDGASHGQQMLNAKDAQELLSLQSNLLQPIAERAASYQRSLYDIAQSTGGEIKSAAESQLVEAQKKFSAMMESAAKNAPGGTEGFVSMVKSTVDAANSAFESVQKAVKQAGDVAQSNFDAASKQATRAAASAAGTMRKQG